MTDWNTPKNHDIEKYRTFSQPGFSYDWDREISTTEPEYYKWTQWIFLQLLKSGLAYQAEVPVNWCPALGTVLANEEVVDGVSERGGHPVIRKFIVYYQAAYAAVDAEDYCIC